MKARSGGHILAEQLKIQGVDRVFCLPGESFLGLLDGLYEQQDHIQVVTTRHEGGAANMAGAYAKMTGRAGVCLVTRGPGATNASIGVHTAFQDSLPLVLFIGQVERAMLDREAFQEVDYCQMFGALAKWVAQIQDAARIPEYIHRAFHTALSGRPGPVVLALPEDILCQEVQVADGRPAVAVQASPSAEKIAMLQNHLEAAQCPLAIVGGATWTAQAVAEMTEFAEAHGLPVATSFRAQDCFDNRHPQYIGSLGIGVNPDLQQFVRACDLLLVFGARLGDITTNGYTLLEPPVLAQSLVHVHAGAEELGRVFQPMVAINAAMPELTKAFKNLSVVVGKQWRARWRKARESYLNYISPTSVPGMLNLGEVISYLNQSLPEDAIIANGAGNYTAWVHRFFQYKTFQTQIAPTNGAMGYAVPAAIGAKMAAPERTVVSFNGDGCFQIFGQELATAVQYHAPVIFIVVNNGMLGTIRMHQERTYPNRVIATDLVNPNFVTLAQAYGIHAERILRTEDFAPAFERAQALGKSALLELVVDPEALTPQQSLTEIRDVRRS